jgi:hypothetical protein
MSDGLLYNAAGFVGMGCVLLAYFMANAGTWHTESRVFHATNLIGALLIIVSLIHGWNLPIFVLEVAWAAIATYGLIRAKAWK